MCQFMQASRVKMARLPLPASRSCEHVTSNSGLSFDKCPSSVSRVRSSVQTFGGPASNFEHWKRDLSPRSPAPPHTYPSSLTTLIRTVALNCGYCRVLRRTTSAYAIPKPCDGSASCISIFDHLALITGLLRKSSSKLLSTHEIRSPCLTVGCSLLATTVDATAMDQTGADAHARRAAELLAVVEAAESTAT